MIAPDYPGFGNSDMPDPAMFAYTFDKISEVVETFLKDRGFDHYGLFVQDYGGPVGFRIVMRHPDALDWLIIQNTNAYEVGFTKAWDGFRGALWKNRSAETEKPLAAFLEHDAIKGIYLFGAKNPELISPDNWESDSAFMQRRQRPPRATRSLLRLSQECRALPQVAGLSEGAAAEDGYLLGPERRLLHAGRWRGLPQRPAQRRNAPFGRRPLRRRGFAQRNRRRHESLLHRSCCPQYEHHECDAVGRAPRPGHIIMTLTSTIATRISDKESHRLVCAEIWGGIGAIDQDVSTAGLTASISSVAAGGEQGGDIHYLSYCRYDFLTRIAIADVRGHGESVTLVSSWVYAAVRRK